MNPLHALRRTPHRVWLLSLAVWLLLLTQMLGLVHRVQHGAVLSSLVAVASADAPPSGHEAGSNECRLFDQLAHADLASLPVVAAVLPVAHATPTTAPPRVALAARLWRAQARGPPAFA